MFNLFNNKDTSSDIYIQVEREFLEEAIQFKIYKIENNKKTILNFPIEYNKYFSSEELNEKDFYLQLQILSSLWNSEELIENNDGSYKISINTLYNYTDNSFKFDNESLGYEDSLLDLLDLKTDEHLKVIIDNKGVIGSTNFALTYDVKSKKHGYISKFHDRIGSFYPYSSNKAFLLSKGLKELFDIIDNPPNKREKQFEWFAKVKTKANKLDVKMNGYLEKEEYYFPEELDVEIKEKAIDHVRLNPQFLELDDELNNETENAISKDKNYTSTKKEEKNKRVFLGENNKEDFKKVLNNKDIKGANVPEFINNPYKFLPETLNLDKFSERVKGLKERIYKAQPFVHGENSNEMNWFDIDTGVKLKGSDENENEEKIEIDEFEKLVEEAKEKGEDYVLWDGKWINITEDSNEFIDKTKEIENLKENGKISKNNLAYIFDIYENVDKLEYNLQMIDFRKSLREAGALDYNKPELFDGELYSYQKYGYLWMNRLKNSSLGGLLADDMGLGKTVQVIALMTRLKEEERLSPSLVVAPKSLLDNWDHEIKEFSSDIDKIYHHMGGSRNKNSEVIKKSDVVLTTYSTLVSDQVLLGEIDWSLLVCDEVQAIRNQSTLKAHAVKAQKADIRLGLSGTPVQNTVADLWSIYDFAQPGLLDSFKDFKDNFVKPIESSVSNEEIEKYEKELKRKIKPVFLRRTKEKELKDELPEKIDKKSKQEMSDRQYKMYVEKIRFEKNSPKNTQLKTLQELLQISSHPDLLTGDWYNKDINKLIEDGPKLKDVIDILGKVRKKNEKVLIFTIYREMQLILEKVIRTKFNLNNIPIINGSTKHRLKAVDNFNNKDGFACMLLSPRAAGTGLNITGANHVIHYTRWWNPAVEQQATDRVYRIGQDKDVYVYYPIMTGPSETVEEKLDRLLEEKKIIANSIVVPNKPFGKELNEEMQKEFEKA